MSGSMDTGVVRADSVPAGEMEGVHILRGDTWNAVAFDRPRPVLSSAPVNGGGTEAVRIVNLCVHGPRSAEFCDDPYACFRELATEQDWSGTTVGLMTGVQASRLGVGRAVRDAVSWLVLATVGCSNAHRAGEAPVAAGGPGTINIIAVCSSGLTAAARAEAVMLVTESKCAFLADAGIESVNGRGPATGTGTDAVAIADGPDDALEYTGYHTPSGLALARATREALSASLAARGKD